jgi:hypothetical protein
MRLDMYDSVDAYLTAFAKTRRVEDGCACGNEHFILDCAAHDMRIRSDEAVIANAEGVTDGTSEYSILHDNALASDGYQTALGNNLRPIHDSATWCYSDVATYHGIRSNPGCRIDLW